MQLAVVVALILALAAPPANAGRIDRAEHAARIAFGDVCRGDVSLRVRPLRGDEAGEAEWSDDGVGPYDCSVTVDAGMPYPTFCAVVVHEYGHLAGREHSADPSSVMYPYVSERNTPPRCRW